MAQGVLVALLPTIFKEKNYIAATKGQYCPRLFVGYLKSETEFYTPPPLEAKIATDTLNHFPAPVVYKISGPKGEGFLYTTV